MLEIPAKTVYIDPEVYTKPNCLVRLNRMLPNIRYQELKQYDAATREQVANIGSRRHGKDAFGDDAIIVFSTFDKSKPNFYYHWRDEATQHQGVCQPGLELNIVSGCIFRCAYCGFGRVVIFYLDIEQFMSNLDTVFVQYPNQRLFKYSNMTDLPPFEPELDAMPPMIDRFTREKDRYLLLFTKSDNIGFLKNLNHQGHTIISWSVSADTASRVIDRRTPSMQERIDAMALAQQSGYPVRARLSPIVPVRDWRKEYTVLFEYLYQKVQPDLVTLELLGWMGFSDMANIFDLDLLDPIAVKSAEQAVETMKDIPWGPFTDEFHQEVYRYCIETSKRISPKTPIAVCHGTKTVWNKLGKLMNMEPEHYLCNCGPDSAPGGRLYPVK
ncbi:MAG: spore photoproduct lyase family protein [bacterium]